MNDKTKASFRIILPVIILFWFSCLAHGQMQTPPAEQIAGSPSALESKRNIGRVGVVPTSFEPEIRFDKPMTKGKAALEGAGIGAVVPVAVGAYSMNPLAVIGGLFLAPVGAAVGSVVGLIKGSSEKEIEETEDTLRGYLATIHFQQTLRERLLAVARDQTQYSFVLLESQGPKSPDEEVTYDMSAYEDIDAVLEVGVSECRLDGKAYEMNPDLQLVVRVDAGFSNAKDGKLYDGSFFHFSSAKQTFADWSTDNARPFREEFDRGLQSLSEQIIKSFIFYANFNAESSEAMKTEER
jgi:hypothetical protein